MKLSDALLGVLFMGLAAAALWFAKDFPEAPGQPYGPATFPTVVAIALGVAGAILTVQGVRQGALLRWVSLSESMRRGRPLASFLAVLVALLAYCFAVESLGFLLLAPVLLLGLMRVFDVRLRTALWASVLSTVLIHLAFYKLLRVPLPWGLLERFAY